MGSEGTAKGLEMIKSKDVIKEGWIGSSEVDGPGATFYDDPVIDNILDALLEATAALWVCKDRMMIMEEVLSDRLGEGFNLSDAIEQHVPSQQLEATRAEQRGALLASVFNSFKRRPMAGVSLDTTTMAETTANPKAGTKAGTTTGEHS